MIKKVLLALGLVIFVFAPGLVFSQIALAYEDTLVIESLRSVEGTITGIDTDTKRVTVRWMYDPIMIRYEDVTLNVPETCVITKESETSELMELEEGDHVSVRYDANAEPLARAISIVVS